MSLLNCSRSRHGLLALTVVFGLALLPVQAAATLITSSGDAALSGALVQDFGTALGADFSSNEFLIGTDGFTVSAVSGEIGFDTGFCGSFGTSGACLDTYAISGGSNDDFDVVFTGAGVSAFGFDITALDNDWTISTYDASNNLLNTYVLASQSPGLSGFDRRGYFGATEVSAIKSFTVRSTGDDRALIDNFAYNPVPEPSTAVLAGLGLLGLASVGRKESGEG